MTSGAGGGATTAPYHHDVFVLTHHPREPVTMAGGTTFHFVPDGIQQVLQRAFGVAGGADVRLFEDLDGALDGYECAEFVSSAAAAHYRLVRRSS